MSNPANRLNIRSGPSTSNSTIGKLSFGSAVQVISSSNGWAKIVAGGQIGYVSQEYLSNTNPTASNTTATSSFDEQQIYDRLIAMSNGTICGSTYKTGTRYTGIYSSEQCKGFAKSIFESLFGYNIGSTKAKPYNYQISISSNTTSLAGSLTNLSYVSNDSIRALFSKARPGDFVQIRRIRGGSHSAIYLSSDIDTVTVFECNVDGRNTIQIAKYSWSKFRSTNSAVSIYTAKDYRLH